MAIIIIGMPAHQEVAVIEYPKKLKFPASMSGHSLQFIKNADFNIFPNLAPFEMLRMMKAFSNLTY